MSATNPRFQVRKPGGPFMRVVWDTWLETEAARFYGGGPAADHETPEATERRAVLLAETRAAELNLPSADPLGFVEKLRQHISDAREEEYNPGDLLEDLDRILEHYAGQIRGTVTEPIRQDMLRAPAPWVNSHGLGA